MPTPVARRLWEKGPASLGDEILQFLLSKCFTSEARPDRNVPRNALFIEAVCETSPDTLQETIQSTRFVIVGCGGLGMSVAIQLASLGARNFVLIDGDRLEQSNLNRSPWFDESDVGRLKVDVLSDFLHVRFSANATQIPQRLGANSAQIVQPLGGNAFVCLLIDDGAAAAEITSGLMQAKVPLVHAGYVGPYCVVGPAVIGTSDPCPFCLSEELILTSGEAFIAPSASPNNSLIAAFLVSQVLRLLAGVPSAIRGRRWALDLRNGEVTWDVMAQNPNCRGCA